MRYYLNDVSLQGQYTQGADFKTTLSALLSARALSPALTALRTTRCLPDRLIMHGVTLRAFVQQCGDRDFVRSVFAWVGRYGPFIEDDRLDEEDDYFECFSVPVTDCGLGEAARRVRIGEQSSTFSFPGGAVDFASSPLAVIHGIPEAPLGTYAVPNYWEVDALVASAREAEVPAATWQELVEQARGRYPHLVLPDAIFRDTRLRREPFESSIRDAVLWQLGILNAYVADLQDDGSQGPIAQEIVENHFTGDRAIFSAESQGNQDKFCDDLTFPDPDDPDKTVFAHFHGKISHRFFRLHFEWPIPDNSRKIKVVYIGPKLTKA